MRLRCPNLNFVSLEGFVNDVQNVMVGDKLCVKATVRLERRSRSVYVEVYGFGNIAQDMVLTCDRGNRVYIEGKLMNAVVRQNRDARAITPYIGVTYVECLYRHVSRKKPFDNMIAVLDGIDPIRYLKKERKRYGRKKLKDDQRVYNDDEE